jgi:hypothetical protein
VYQAGLKLSHCIYKSASRTEASRRPPPRIHRCNQHLMWHSASDGGSSQSVGWVKGRLLFCHLFLSTGGGLASPWRPPLCLAKESHPRQEFHPISLGPQELPLRHPVPMPGVAVIARWLPPPHCTLPLKSESWHGCFSCVKHCLPDSCPHPHAYSSCHCCHHHPQLEE